MLPAMAKQPKPDSNAIRSEDAEIGGRFAAARKEAGLTQGEVAERMGWGSKEDLIGQKRISAYETGRRSLELLDALAYAKAIGTDLHTILGIKPSAARPKTKK